MSNMFSSDLSNSNIDSDIVKHLPKSLQLMVEIERQAQAKFNEIMAAIERGETTLEEVKRRRGLL